MKTGRDANRSGLYLSECCLQESRFTRGQMFSRCPRCSALTIWEFVEKADQPAQFPAEGINPEDRDFIPAGI